MELIILRLIGGSWRPCAVICDTPAVVIDTLIHYHPQWQAGNYRWKVRRMP
jgi:hypothetical protein